MRNLFDVLISINLLKQIIQLPKAIDFDRAPRCGR